MIAILVVIDKWKRWKLFLSHLTLWNNCAIKIFLSLYKVTWHVRYEWTSTVNVPNKSRCFGGLNKSTFWKLALYDNVKIFIYLSREMFSLLGN